MSNQNLILMLVILFFVLGCSFKCTGIKENFACNKIQCNDILEMEGGDKTKTCNYKMNNRQICNTCGFCNENFTMGHHHKRVRRSIYNCSECETECSAAHCQRNAGWCIQHLGIEYAEKCNKLKEEFSDTYRICDICKNDCKSTNCSQHKDWCEKQGKPFDKNCAKSKYDLI